jgi:hypothetical protein
MKDLYIKEKDTSYLIKDLPPLRTMLSGLGKEEKCVLATRPLVVTILPKLLLRAVKLNTPNLIVFPLTIKVTGKGNYTMQVKCKKCGLIQWKWLHNLEAGKSGCRCSVHSKYNDPRASMLGARYQAMIQRCHQTTHVSDHNYRQRGIRVIFSSREDFITWALKNWPHETFKGKDFDRKDNNGDYSKDNLRLLTRSQNLRNTRVAINSIRAQAELFKQTYPDVTYTEKTIWNLLQKGLTPAAIMKKWTDCGTPPPKRKRKIGAIKLAKDFLILHADIKLGVKQVAECLSRGETYEIMIKRQEKEFDRIQNSVAAAYRKVCQMNPGFSYAEITFRKLIKKGLKETDIVAKWKEKDSK